MRLVGGDLQAALAQYREDTGEVALAVRVADLLERTDERRAVEGVGADVDLADGEDLGRYAVGVFRLHDPLHRPVGCAHDPPVGRRVEPVCGQQRRARGLAHVVFHQAGDQLGARERHDAGEHHGGLALRERLARRQHRGPGPFAAFLLDHLDGIR